MLPASMNGDAIQAGRAMNMAASIGGNIGPRERAKSVMPAAAERSSGATTANVYDCRVGTSICEMLKRRSRIMIAHVSLGISGTRIKRMLDGMWVKTIVFTKPIR